MKIVIPTNSNILEDEISKSFGRSKNFVIIDSDSMSFDIVENIQNMESSQGAGIQSAQTIIKAGADILITINCGPKAYKVLSASGIKVYSGIDGTIMYNIKQYKSRKLHSMADANVEGHWV
ncbi:MAG: NifB/NifX family molybdenum-iron cluster-binding protein [Eubacteriales bacterium]